MTSKLGGAFVLGASGEVGREVIKTLAHQNPFSKVVVITRRELPKEDIPDDFEQKIVDFDKIEDYGEIFQGLEYGFCSLGTTRGKSGAAGFYKVDHDYVVNTAKVALNNGCKNFTLVTSTGADPNSKFLYSQTKGQAEEDVKALGFERLSIFRPAMLDCDRREQRPLEKVAYYALQPLHWMFPTRVFMKTSTLAKIMIHNAENPTGEKNQIFLNPDLCRIAQEIETDKL